MKKSYSRFPKVVAFFIVGVLFVVGCNKLGSEDKPEDKVSTQSVKTELAKEVAKEIANNPEQLKEIAKAMLASEETKQMLVDAVKLELGSVKVQAATKPQVSVPTPTMPTVPTPTMPDLPETPGLAAVLAENAAEVLTSIQNFELDVRNTLYTKTCQRLYKYSTSPTKQQDIDECVQLKEDSQTIKRQILDTRTNNLRTSAQEARAVIQEVRASIDGQQAKLAWTTFVVAVENFRTAVAEKRQEAKANAEATWLKLQTAVSANSKVIVAMQKHADRQANIQSQIDEIIADAVVRGYIQGLFEQFITNAQDKAQVAKDMAQVADLLAKVQDAIKGFRENGYGKKVANSLKVAMPQVAGNIDGELVRALIDAAQTRDVTLQSLVTCVQQQK